MGAFTLATTIDRSPADVFGVVGDPRQMSRWYEAVLSVHDASGPPSVGTTYTMTRSLPGGHAQNTVAIAEYVPDRRIAIESRDGPTPFRYRYELQPTADGTAVTLEASITGDGLHGPVARIDSLVTRAFRKGMTENLRTLKHLVETTAAA